MKKRGQSEKNRQKAQIQLLNDYHKMKCMRRTNVQEDESANEAHDDDNVNIILEMK